MIVPISDKVTSNIVTIISYIATPAITFDKEDASKSFKKRPLQQSETETQKSSKRRRKAKRNVLLCKVFEQT
jgi:hypothetical protein